MLEKYGYAAIIASRPIPVLAESVAVIGSTLNLGSAKYCSTRQSG